MKHYVCYLPSRLITNFGTCVDDALAIQPRPGESVIETAFTSDRMDADYYVEGGILIDRKPMPITVDKTTVVANGTDYCTFTGVPMLASVEIDDEVLGTTDGSNVEITFDTEGKHIVAITLFPFLRYEVTINAT